MAVTVSHHDDRTDAERPPESRIFGVGVETALPEEMLRHILGFVERREHRRVAYVNAHVLNQSFENPTVRAALLDADLVYCDGYGVRLAARTIGLPAPHRMTGADWVWNLACLSEAQGRSIYLLGAEPGAAGDAAEALRKRHPRLEVVGTHHGYFPLEGPHNERVLEDIAHHRPDILLVGMGTPQQELWVHRHFDRIEANVVWTVGALFDYVSGRMARAPQLMADNGLEWIFRLAMEPRRMWRRYLIGNPIFLRRVMEARHDRTSDRPGGP